MYDMIIRNGYIVDGSGRDIFKADLGIQGEKIIKIGSLEDKTAGKVIDAKGKYVTPGFIDPHTHADITVLYAPEMEAQLRQGVTTAVTGNCGHGMAPIGTEVLRGPFMNMEFINEVSPSYFDLFPMYLPKEASARALEKIYGIELDWTDFASFNRKCEKCRPGCNLVPLAGYSAIRNAVMGRDCMREAAPDELKRLEELTEECMRQGAFGLTTGRDPNYIPGFYASTDEMERMLKITARYGGIFASHTYNFNREGRQDRMGGYKEMFELGRRADIRTHVSHVHVLRMADNDKGALKAAKKTIELFEQVAREGLDLSYDIIPSPFVADFTVPYFAFYLKPLVLISGSRKHLAENFRYPDFRVMVRHIIKAGMMSFFNPDSPSNWFSAFCILGHKEKRFTGKTFTECAAELKTDPLECMMELFSRDPDMSANMVTPDFTEANDFLCSHKWAMPCSDSFTFSKETNLTGNEEMPLYPNATTVSFIPRFLKRQGKEKLAWSVYHASGYVAERFGIEERGKLAEGYYADIVILDYDSLKSYDMEPQPLQNPEGIEYVLVNGSIVLEDKLLLGGRRGKVLAKSVK